MAMRATAIAVTRLISGRTEPAARKHNISVLLSKMSMAINHTMNVWRCHCIPLWLLVSSGTGSFTEDSSTTTEVEITEVQ